MVPLSRPHGAPESRKGILELYEAHMHTTRSTGRAIGTRSLESPIGTACSLYIFVGFLICLCIAAPVIAILRKNRDRYVADHVERAKRAVVEADGRVAESLAQEQERYRTSQREHENRLREEQLQLQTSQQQIRDLERTMRDREQALTMVQRDRDAALEMAREARQSRATTLETIQNLESEVQTRDERLRLLQQRYNHVDQEYRRLLFEMAGNET